MEIDNFRHTLFNVVGRDSRIEGELRLSGPSNVAGEVVGTLYGPTEGRLVLDRSSKVTGEVHAHDLEVHGQLDGTVHCTGTLSLRPGCQFKGVLRAGKLVVYPGAVVDMDAETDNS